MPTRVLEARFVACMCAAALLAACGGGGDTGNDRDSGPQQTTLRVEAADADGDALRYEWRVTGGSVDNRNARETVWTLPAGRGLHFAYVMVSDGRGGYAERQYAVSTDELGIDAPARAPVAYEPPTASTIGDESVVRRLRFAAPNDLMFADAGAGAGERSVYLADTPVSVLSGGTVVFSGVTDTAGELSLPKLPPGSYSLSCASTPGAAMSGCGAVNVSAEGSSGSSSVVTPPTLVDSGSNLRVYGHVSLADDGVCGNHNDFFGVRDSATVQLKRSDGSAVTPPRRVNRFGDYFVDAAVADATPLELHVACGSELTVIEVSPDIGTPGSPGFERSFQRKSPFELTRRTTNRRPAITRMVANGPDGNVRGREVLAEDGAISNTLPGFDRFLAYKGTDTARSACLYYRSFGAVRECDAQGRMQGAISFEDWKRHHGFRPYGNGSAEVAATYINQRDLNLVRRMFANKVSDTQIAFYVCNNPGPESRTQAAVNEVVRFGVASERRVACVAMEWSVTPGVNLVGGAEQPFTKFLTFGPEGSLIASVNLDGRGEKYMPGACIACHGGSQVGGRFPDSGNPSPFLGSRFLPFDTGNYLFSTDPALTEAAQSKSLYDLNQYVKATEGGAATATAKLVDGWYADGTLTLKKSYVPVDPLDPDPANPSVGWHASPEKAQFYREVIGTSCRTCHAALGSAVTRFDWDSRPDRFEGTDSVVFQHVCGGTANLAVNGSMPNALASLDRLLDGNSPGIAARRELMQRFLGCSAPAADPVFPRR